VEVYVDALGQTLEGTVEAIIPATTSTFSLLPAHNTAGSFTKIVQLVPVKIALRGGDAPLIVGASVRVRIHVQPADAR
jgi:membrane fusion protein, multidrug efflux system